MKQISRFTSRFCAGLIGSAALTLMIALFLMAQGTDPARYNAPSKILEQMQDADAAVNEDAFELRFGLQKSCDALNDEMTALSLLRVRLQASLNALDSKTSITMQQALSELDRKMAAKQEQAERFKTSNAVMSNSRYYFPSVCAFVRRRYARNAAYPELDADLAALEHDVLLYNMSGEPTLSSASLARIRRLQAKETRSGSEAQSDLHSLLLHAAMLVQSKQRVDAHLAALIAVPLAAACGTVSACLEQRRQAEFQTATIYRAALLLVGLLVFAYAMSAFLKTRQQARELYAANATLEARVSDRTHDLQSANAELQQSEQRLRAIFANASIGIGQLSLTGTLLQANAALCAMLACGEAELLETALSRFMEKPDQGRFEESLSTLQVSTESARQDKSPTDKAACVEINFMCSDGVERRGEVRLSLVCAENEAPLFFILLVQDVTAQRAAEHHIEQLAFHDSLTGLPNRAAFKARLKEALECAETKRQRMALLFIDCDNFKQINDMLGHQAGDEFLKQRAECMQDSLRPGDTLARLGGDEFTILLEDLPDEETALHIARRVQENLSKPMRLLGNEVFGGASIGIAFNQGDEVTVESMLRNADTAMYQVKTSGKGGCTVFTQDMNDRINEQMRIENGLRHALENGELCVHYQPLIDLETGQMTGTEALVRWTHPEWGLLSPGKFIPIAEDTGLIVPLGYWVLEEACRQTKQWQTQWPQHPPLMVNVNLSGHQLKRADIVEKIVEIVLKTDLPMRCLTLEITESVMMNNMEDAQQKLNRLKALGINIALDDFGTGYSSVASLVDLPVDSIKIDRSFVARLGDHEQADATIAAIIALAKAHGLNVTGEGVETQDQVTLLQSYGCTLGQGYFFAKPLPADALNSDILAENASFVSKIAPMDREHIEQLLDQFNDPGNPQMKMAA